VLLDRSRVVEFVYDGRVRLVCVLVALLSATETRADNLMRDEARAHSALAKVEFDRHRYREALAEFKRAYELAPVTDLLFNIARCQDLMGDAAAAIESYERYLAAKPDSEDRPAIETQIANLRKSLPVSPAPTPKVEPPPPAVTAPIVTSSPIPEKRSHRGVWIGVGVGAGLLAVGAVVLGVVLGRPAAPEPYRGNFSPMVAPINP
jgi:tetratricopeptide (TPR) repeat protein